MSKLEDAKKILDALQVPLRQQSDLCCYVLLAMAGLRRRDPWEFATNEWSSIPDIIGSIRENYSVIYAESSGETIRKQAMHHFRNAAFIEDNGLATNNPNHSYRLTEEMLSLVQAYPKDGWKEKLNDFLSHHETLIDLYSAKRSFRRIPVTVNGKEIRFSPDDHDRLHRAIMEEFAPRFAPDCVCLYVSDATEKDLVKDGDELRALGFEIAPDDRMPDVVLYSREKDWLYFIEAVTSAGPMDPKRIQEIEDMTQTVTAGKIYVTAFGDFKTFQAFAASLAWETEVWIASLPDHMIHLDGERFLGPRSKIK